MPQGQHAENLAWLRARLDGRLPQAAGLRSLVERALAGDGEPLRLSPHRSVLRLEARDRRAAPDGWLLKIAHPRRRGEVWRRLLRPDPVRREAEAWRLLAARLERTMPVETAHLRLGIDVLARPFLAGEPAQPDASTAAALAGLHALHWADRDLALADLLWVDGQLLPLDLGQAQLAAFPLAPEPIHRALVRLLAGLAPDAAERFAPLLLNAHAEMLPDWQAAELLARARVLRRRRAWRRSRRALRSCADFQREPDAARRRGFGVEFPSATEPADAQLLASGPRSRSWRQTEVVWKHYPRRGWLQRLRRAGGAGPGQRAYRRLALLEGLHLPAARPLAWRRQADGEWLAAAWVAGRPAEAGDLPALAEALAALHRHGLGLRDAKASNFVLPLASPAVLIDADGIQPRASDPVRDLARLLAECPTDDARTAAARTAYQARLGRPFRPREDARLARETARFRQVLAAATPRA